MVSDLSVTWVAAQDAGQRILSRDAGAEHRQSLIGPLNANSPNRVQILGSAEIRLISRNPDTDRLTNQRSGEESDATDAVQHANQFTQKAFDYLQNDTELIVITDGQQAPPSLLALATEHKIPVFLSTCSYSDCLNTLRYRLTQFLAPRSIIHGVLMDVLGTGVLITGRSGVGKSELALELVSRGHILVADDAPEFRRIAPETLEGSCPQLLRGFLEVRGLGILNIARMYGHAHTRRRKILKFIIELKTMDPDSLQNTIDRLEEVHRVRDILDVKIRERTIPVAPGRNLAVLVEAAVRNHILSDTGYDASDDLIEKQAVMLEQN